MRRANISRASAPSPLGAYLFSCCMDSAEPDWTRFDGIEVQPCVTRCADCDAIVQKGGTCEHSDDARREHGEDFETYTEATDDPTQPGAFWTVYGHFTESDTFAGVDALADFDTESEARAVAALFGRFISKAGAA